MNDAEVNDLLTLENVTLEFAGLRALDDVTLEVGEAQLMAIIGPNGAGKSSLFNCISGLYRPTRGRIALEGRDITRMAAHDIAALGVARVFQNLALFDNLSTLDNLMVGRHHCIRSSWWQDLLGLPASLDQERRHRARAEELIDFLHLEAYRLYPVGMLPYGVRKRIELGRALCMEPRLLLLDEPAAGLNNEETEDLAAYLLDIRAELSTTIVLIEHELGFVMDLADEVSVLDFGRLIARGTPAEVRNDPAVIEAYIGGVADAGGEADAGEAEVA